MRKLAFVLASLVAPLAPLVASADERIEAPTQAAAIAERDVAQATAMERETSTRVAYYASLTRIAERDLATAQVRMNLYYNKWQRAVEAGDADAAGSWAKKYTEARGDYDAAHGKVLLYRSERDIARDEFQVAVRDLRRVMQRSQDRQRG